MFSNSCRKDFDRVDGDMVREGVSGCVKTISKRIRRFLMRFGLGHREGQFQNPGQQKANLTYFKMLPQASHKCEKVCT